MKSVMNHSFSQVPRAEIPRSQFDRSHGVKTTFDAGSLVPIFVDEALPGDTFNLQLSAFARLATPIVPIMDNLFIDTFFFAVPNRLVWDNWQKFNGEQTDPGDSTDYLVPQIEADGDVGYTNGSLGDYFGLPTQVPGFTSSALWHRAYKLIWNEWFRDQNLQDSIPIDKGDGPDENPPGSGLLPRGKRHDYFTSCLPWPQKGPAVQIPLGSVAPVTGIGKLDQTFTNSSAAVFETGGADTYTKWSAINPGAVGTSFIIQGQTDNLPAIYADLSDATAATINSLRQAFQLQKLYERDARGGTRYTEIILAHFGVSSPDARLQRPEYLGGSSRPINIQPVPQQSSTDATSPQGNLAAFGTHSQTGTGFVKSFTEHTLIIGLVNVRADLNYQQGVNRMFSRRTRWDFYWPALSHIGEQAVLNKEIYASGNPVTDEQVFGYQERYAEYRYKPSIVTGKFRSNATGSLDIWHLSQEFDSLPVLNAEFIVDNPPIDRIIAVPTEPQILFDAYFTLKTARPMPTYSVPGLIDHF